MNFKDVPLTVTVKKGTILQAKRRFRSTRELTEKARTKRNY